jgi:hypothetical protein
MRISLRDPDGNETSFARVADAQEAPSEAMVLLAHFGRIDPGAMLVFEDNNPRRMPNTPTTVSAGNIRSLAGRLEHRADVIAREQPLSAEDLRLAARLCRHILKVGWVLTNVAVA